MVMALALNAVYHGADEERNNEVLREGEE